MIDHSQQLDPNHHQIQHVTTEEILQMRCLQEGNSAPTVSLSNKKL
jgi:hypothetical protein